jgi:hypothetical protein
VLSKAVVAKAVEMPVTASVAVTVTVAVTVAVAVAIRPGLDLGAASRVSVKAGSGDRSFESVGGLA